MSGTRGMTAQEIADDLAARIEDGEWPTEGTESDRRFLTRDKIREEYGSHLNTVEFAIRILRTSGLLVSRPRGGTFIRPQREHVMAVRDGDGLSWDRLEPAREGDRVMEWALGELPGGLPFRPVASRWVAVRDGEVRVLIDTYSVSEEVDLKRVQEVARWDRVRTWLPSEREAAALEMPMEIPVIGFLSRVEFGVIIRMYPGDQAEGSPRPDRIEDVEI